MNSTYSFSDLVGTMSQADVGSYSFTGQGVGEMSITYAAERTVHDVAADGSVMASKIANNTGACALQVQQTSDLHTYLLNWFNYLWTAPTSKWTSTSITIRSLTMNKTYVLTGISPQKIGDTPYQAQGQRITWNLMACDVQTLTA